MMDVAFYHDDGLVNYDQQSSPSSVGSAGSTDIGVVPAICPPYSSANFNKETVLKGLNLDLSPREQLKLQHLKANENTVISSTGALRMNNTERINGNTQHRVSNGGTISEQAVHHNGVITSAYGPLVTASTLASPDVNMLKLGSPDLERLISDNQHHNGHYLPQKQQFAPGVTEEQEMYAQGFERELERIKSRSGSNPDIQASQPASSVVSESSQCSVITTGVNQQLARQHQPFLAEQYYHQQAVNATPGMAGNQPVGSTIHHMNPVLSHLKEEPPQTVPVLSHTPPMSPIDLVSQEMLKSERKRQRNRIAASKCRKRKLERISRLEDKVKSLKTQNMELSTNANILRQQVADLKSKVMAHVNSGCQLMMSQQQATF